MASISSILITGGAGFIGSTLVRQWLAEEQDAVVNLDALTYAGLRESLAEVAKNPRHALIEGDVGDGRIIGQLLAEHRPRAILHLAAETHVDRSIVEPPRFVRTNVLGTAVLLEQAVAYWQSLGGAARDQFRFLLVSTDEVFGSAAAGQVFAADDPLRPSSPYAASKAAAEHLVWASHRTYGLPVVAINPTNNYGARQMPEKLVPRMIVAAMRGEPLPLYGDGLHERDWLHVEDCCRAIRAVLRGGVPGRRYLVGAGNPTPNLRIAEQICDLVDELLVDAPLPSGLSRRTMIKHVTDRPGHDRRYAVDSTPPREELRWQPTIEFAAGLRETVRWYVDNPAWVATAEASLARRG